MATPQEYVTFVQDTVFPAVRAQLTAWADHAATLGDVDPDLTEAQTALEGFLTEVEAAGPAALNPADPTPLPDVPPDLPVEPTP